MSTRAGGRHKPAPDSPSSTRCSWPMCTTPVTYRFMDAGVLLCQDHALHTWAVVQDMNATQGAREPAPRQREEVVGQVYYLRIGDRVKIGHSTNIFQRLASYPPNTEVLHIRDGSRELEHQEHIRFSEHRTDGREWFHANERVLQMISDMADGHHREWEPEWFQRRTHQPQTITHRKVNEERSSHGH